MSKKKKRKKAKKSAGVTGGTRTAELFVTVLTQAAGDLLGDVVEYAAKRYEAYRKARRDRARFHRPAEAS